MLRRGGLAAAATALLLAGAAQATTFSFNGGNVVPICPLSGSTYTCSSLPNSADTDVIVIASGYTVVVNSAVAFTYNQGLLMSGSASLQSKSNLTVADVNPANLKITGGSLSASGTFSAGNQAQTITADISAATINIGSGSATQINGALAATSQITLAANVSVVGNVVAPTVLLKASNTSVKGNIAASSALTIESNNTVNGSISGGALTMNDGGVVINGNVAMSGDVSIGSSDTINGNLVARNVTTKASGDYISGNAAVNAIYLDYGATVGKVITCTGPGASGCSCVTRADSNYHPTCGAAAPSGADHIQITHNGQGLTCQPSPVSLRACADANCTSTYNGSTTVTLTPGGGQVTFTGTASASVYDQKAETVALSAGANTSCINSASSSGNPCNMTFSASGVQLSVPDHVSMTPGVLMTIQALKAGPNNSSCVPLAQGSVPISFSCSYKDPATGQGSLMLGSADTPVACGSGTASVNVTLDSSGAGTLSLKYPDVGLVGVSANYSTSTVNAAGSTSFTAAPKAFRIDAKPVNTVTLNDKATPPAFARASDPFNLTITALNYSDQPTLNFGKESSAQVIKLSKILKLPSDGVDATQQGTFTAIDKGFTTSTSDAKGPWVFAETGTLTLSATLDNASHSGYYMDKSRTDFKTSGAIDLRFVPHHFNTILLAGPQMSCVNLGGYNNPCATGDSFVYSKQGFNVQVNAYRTDKDLSQNYRLRTPGKTDTADVVQAITLSAAQTANGNASTDFKGLSSNITYTFAIDAPSVNGTGVGTLSAGSQIPALEFNANQAPPNTPSAPTTIFLRATDADFASSQRAGSTEAPLTVVSGKMMISNAFGPSTSAVPVEVRAMYYSAAAKAWLFNPVFNLATGIPLAASDGDYTFNGQATCTGALNCGTLKLVAGTLQFKNGKGMFSMAAPNASGTVKVSLKPVATAIPYLPIYESGTITFGVFRSGPVIYTREVYN
jgi:MSHA biogenesis protein MshQ